MDQASQFISTKSKKKEKKNNNNEIKIKMFIIREVNSDMPIYILTEQMFENIITKIQTTTTTTTTTTT